MMAYISQQYKLTGKLKKVLQKQTISLQEPGSILADFQSLLDFVAGRDIGVTGTYLLPLKSLRPLNDRLSRPLQLGLKRPQQKSFPHINGLYQLLRATGLGQIAARPKKPQLVLDPELLPSWQSLNPTERYMSLLETWLLRASDEIIGERGGVWDDFALGNWASFFQRVPAEGLQIAGDSEAEYSLRYWPKLHNLALLELFGLVDIEPGPRVEGEGWQIKRIWWTPLGEALLALLTTWMQEQFDEIFDDEEPSEISFGVLQPVLQPYFPEWRNNLAVPAERFQAGLYVFKVSLGKIWRRIAIPAELTLDALAVAIINAYEFDFDHLYQFTYMNRFGVSKRVAHPYMEEYVSTSEVRIGELPLQGGQPMEFLYDFGACWRFDVTLEAVEPVDPTLNKAQVIEKKGQAPEQYGW